MGSDQTLKSAVKGVVVEILPALAYRVELADRRQVTAHLAPAVRRGFVRLRVRDQVELELASADPNRGRIVKILEPRA